MVDEVAPLGIPRSAWGGLTHSMFSAFSAARLNHLDLQIKVGGSSVGGGFSSLATTLKKKRFPRDERCLINALERKHLMLDEPQKSLLIGTVTEFWRQFKPAERPSSPWWGVMHKLTLEDPPDLDIQVWHPGIDEAILSDGELRDVALESQRTDRWNLWPEWVVHARFPELQTLQGVMNGSGYDVQFEFLALEEGRKRIASRTDWMEVRKTPA